MSRGPGRIERTIAAIFAREPDNAFTVRELAPRIYPECVEYHLKEHGAAEPVSNLRARPCLRNW